MLAGVGHAPWMGGTDAAGAWSHRGSTLIEVRNGGGAPVMVGAPAVLRGDGRYGAITVGSHTRVRH
ncbi:hypothetical protein JCM18916_2723 [Cutibacterium acnes JCM 18916]|nr:hypothetical protein JCM18916_2723 [Cutibacterium acnes JCM 18916]